MTTDTLDFFTLANTPGYTAAGLRNLNRARAIIMQEHGFGMDCLPAPVLTEIDQSIRDGLTNTHGRNLSVRLLLSLWEG